jgi:hypothetical protein
MFQLNCPECYRQISDQAVSCPNCGFPIASHLEKQKAELLKTQTQIHLLKNINPTDCIVKHDRLGLRARVHECLRLEELWEIRGAVGNHAKCGVYQVVNLVISSKLIFQNLYPIS